MEDFLKNYKSRISALNRQITQISIEKNELLAICGNTGSKNYYAEYKTDLKGNIIDVNQKLAKLLGYESREELLTAIKSKEYQFDKNREIPLMKTDFLYDNKFSIQNKSGKIVELSECILKQTVDGKKCYLGLVKKRNFASTEIKKDDRWSYIELFFEKQKEGIVIFNRDFKLIYANVAICEMLGYTKDDMENHSVADFVNPSYSGILKSAVSKSIEKMIQTEKISSLVYKKDGSEKMIELYEIPYLYEKEIVMIVVVTDMNELEEKEKEYIELEQNFTNTTNNISELTIVLSQKGDICELNESAVKLWGFDYNSYLNKSIFDLGNFGAQKFSDFVESIANISKFKDADFLAKNTVYGDIKMLARLVPYKRQGRNLIMLILQDRSKLVQLQENFQKEYRRSQLLFENPYTGIIVTYKKEIVKVNTVAYKILKVEEDIRGKQFSSLFLEYRKKRRKIIFTDKGKRAEVFELEYNKGDQRIFLGFHILEEADDYKICTFSEILKESKTKNLGETENRYKAVVEQSPCGLLVGDEHGNIIEASDRFCDMIKRPVSDIVGRNISDGFFSSRSLSKLPLDYGGLDEGKMLCSERELICGDGTIKVIEMYSCAVSNNMYQSIYLDITKRKIFENELIESRKKIKELEQQKLHSLEHSREVVLIMDSDVSIKNAYVGMESSFYEFLRNKKDYVADIVNYVKENDVYMLLKQKIKGLLESEKSITADTDIYIKGLRFSIEARFSFMGSDIVVFVTDVTEKMKFINKLNSALKKATESENLESKFLSNLTHEIRTPMNGIIGFADLLLQDEKDPDKREYLDIIQKSTHQLLNIISDILEMSKLEVGMEEPKSEIIELGQLLFDVYDITKLDKKLLSNKLKYINKSVGKYPLYVVSDNVKLRQIILNLVSNAIKYTNEGSIEIDFDEKNDKSIIIVKDTGIGIPESEMSHIFDRFYRVTPLGGVTYNGAGLGLSIAKSYVDLLKGKIWLESEVGKGTTFFVELPTKFSKI